MLLLAVRKKRILLCVQHRPLTAAGEEEEEEEEEKGLSPGDRPTLYGVEIGTHARRGGAREERRSIASSPSSSSLGAWAGLAYERSSFGIESGRINEKVALFGVPFSVSFPPLPSCQDKERTVCLSRPPTQGEQERERRPLSSCVCLCISPFASVPVDGARDSEEGGEIPFFVNSALCERPNKC